MHHIGSRELEVTLVNSEIVKHTGHSDKGQGSKKSGIQPRIEACITTADDVYYFEEINSCSHKDERATEKYPESHPLSYLLARPQPLLQLIVSASRSGVRNRPGCFLLDVELSILQELY